VSGSDDGSWGSPRGGGGDCPDPADDPAAQRLIDAIRDCGGTLPTVDCGDCGEGSCGRYFWDEQSICIDLEQDCEPQDTLLHELYHAFDAECEHDSKPWEEVSCSEQIATEIRAYFCTGQCDNA